MFINNIRKSELTSSTLLRSLQQFPYFTETVSITQIRLKRLEFTQMFLIVSKFQGSVVYYPNWNESV